MLNDTPQPPNNHFGSYDADLEDYPPSSLLDDHASDCDDPATLGITPVQTSLLLHSDFLALLIER